MNEFPLDISLLMEAFREFGYDIDYSKASPDFNLIHKNKSRISVEAVTSNPSEIPSLIVKNSKIEENNFLDESTLKLAGKIWDKLKLYLGDGKKKHPYSSLSHVKENPFVLAVAPFDRQLAQSQNNTAINRVLYGLEPPTSYHEPQKSVKCILNSNNKSVNLGIFTNDSYKEISAVIFSTTGTFGKAVAMAGSAEIVKVTKLRKLGIVEFIAKEGVDKIGKSHIQVSETFDIFSERFFSGFDVCGYDLYLYKANDHKETHLDGFQVYHNPYALHPISLDDFNSPEVVHYFYDNESGTMDIKYNDNVMVSRNTITATSVA